MDNSEEHAPAPEMPAQSDDTADDGANEADEALRITTLRSPSGGFSQRRLLNWVSVGVVAAVMLALGIHWLPGLLAAHITAQPTLTPARLNATLSPVSNGIPPARGTGWRRIGADWAQSIAFAPDDETGYACGSLGSSDNAPILVSRFAVNSIDPVEWKASLTPATGISCQISVSPINVDDVVLVVNHCPTGACTAPSSVYRAHDGGETWNPVSLPAPLYVIEVAWTYSALYLAVWGHLPDDDTLPAFSSTKQSDHLLISWGGGPLTEVLPKRLTGQAKLFDLISFYSTGTTLYTSLDIPCASYCPAIARTDDDGAHWTPVFGTYADRPITLSAAQSGGEALVGSVFQLSDQATVLLRSMDKGATWQPLPALPVNPSTGGATVFISPNGSLIAFCYGDASAVYSLGAESNGWQMVGALPSGSPLAVQYMESGQASALWGTVGDAANSPGLEYFPLLTTTP